MASITTLRDNHVEVSYPMREARQTITKAEYDLVLSLSDNRIAAIKFIRDQYSLGLYEARQIVDTIHGYKV